MKMMSFVKLNSNAAHVFREQNYCINCVYQLLKKQCNINGQQLLSIPSKSQVLSKQYHTVNKNCNYFLKSGHSSLLTRSFTAGGEGRTSTSWWNRLAFVAGIGALAYSIKVREDKMKELVEEKTRYIELNEKTPIGGEWMLTDDNGEKRSSREFSGKWMVLYFGFTHCPDICPDEMEKLTKIVNNIDKRKDLPNLQPIFITLDPERDTPKVIKEYLKDFKIPRVVGFTADTVDEIKQVAKKYRVYFGKGEPDEDNDYIIDHTIIIYLVNSDGQFCNYYGRGLDAPAVTESIIKHMEKFKQLKLKKMIP